jgi:hypothetical protein
MADVGDVLDEFFSPFSSEKLWVFPETDDYTKLVRGWQAVINALARIKARLAANCAHWQANNVSNPAWTPTMSDAPKVNADREFVQSPPGTDPDTCEKAFIIYAGSIAAKTVLGGVVGGILAPPIQTRDLYLCSIGSFNIYTTVDLIDCGAKTAKMNFWMYNSMSKRSFGKFASNPVFKACGMKTQFMWWNWVESVDWSSGSVRTLPGVTPGGTSGGGW